MRRFHLISAAYLLIFTYLSYCRYLYCTARSADLGIYLHKVWALGEGRWRNSLFHQAGIWEDHLEPILYLFVPFAKLGVPIPFLLLLVQAGAVAAMSWLVFLYARQHADRGMTTALAILLALLPLLHPAMQNANLFEFHALLLALPLLAGFLLAASRQKNTLATACLFGALLCREEVAAVLLLWGVWQLIYLPANRGQAIGIVLIALLWTGSSLLLKSNDISHAVFAHRFVWDGNFFATYGVKKLLPLVLLLVGFAFLSLFRPQKLLWISIPLLLTLVSSSVGDTRLDLHYLSIYIPFLAFTAVDGLAAIRQRWPHLISPVMLVAVIAIAAANSYYFSEAPWGRGGNWDDYHDNAYAQEMRQVKSLVGPLASVSLPPDIVAHFARRPEIYFGLNVKADNIIMPTTPRRLLNQNDESYQQRLQKYLDYRRVFDR